MVDILSSGQPDMIDIRVEPDPKFRDNIEIHTIPEVPVDPDSLRLTLYSTQFEEVDVFGELQDMLDQNAIDPDDLMNHTEEDLDYQRAKTGAEYAPSVYAYPAYENDFTVKPPIASSTDHWGALILEHLARTNPGMDLPTYDDLQDILDRASTSSNGQDWATNMMGLVNWQDFNDRNLAEPWIDLMARPLVRAYAEILPDYELVPRFSVVAAVSNKKATDIPLINRFADHLRAPEPVIRPLPVDVSRDLITGRLEPSDTLGWMFDDPTEAVSDVFMDHGRFPRYTFVDLTLVPRD